MLIDNYKEFNVGMKVIIIREASNWNSELNENSPYDMNIKYPYHCTIKKMNKDNLTSYISMTCGLCGWALDTLIEDNLIILDIKEIRKDKLLKLENCENL
jgi:hypothetical protein